MLSSELIAYCVLLVVVSMAVLCIHIKRRLSRPLTLRHRLLASGSVNRA